MQRYFRQPLPNFVDSLVRSFGRAEGKTPAKPFIFDPNFAIMKKTIVPLFCALFGLSLATTSCQDMLTPDMDRYAENFSGKDTVNFYFGILNNVQGMIEQNVLLGELRGDLVKPTEFVSDSINDIINFNNLEDGENALLNRAAYYKVINQCNFYLAKADSMALKNNSYYMRRELAQVQLVRAWTYMQLVQLYGRVPFITDPVSTSDTGWEKNPPLGWATPSNLLNLLEDKGGLKQAYAYTKQLGYPSYGKFNNGAENFDQSLSLFNANLVYADLYLLRGSNKGDYEQAASYYYKYLKEDTKASVSGVAAVNHFVSSAGDDYFALIPISNFAGNRSMASGGEIVGAVPAASNSFFGQVLTRVPQIYGFDATSSNSTTTRKEKGTDGKENLITAIEIAAARDEAGRPRVPEVSLFFENYLMRGNRTSKISADQFSAFESYNYPHLAYAGIEIRYHDAVIANAHVGRTLSVRPYFDPHVAVLKLFPGITREVVDAVLSVPSLRGVVMETFGSGNAPMMPWFLDALRAAVARGVVIVNVTQCVTGYVDMTRYETGVLLEKIGLVSGRDATTEAALTKLMYLLGQGFSSEEVSRLMAIPLRGEMSLDQEMEGFSREISIYRR